MRQNDDSMTAKESGPRPYVPSRFFMSRVVNPITLWLGGPTLTVRGRRTGRPIRTPVPALEVNGARYLVSGGGDTHWVRNLRAAGEGELRRGRLHEPFRAVEVDGDEHDRVVTAYREHMGWRAREFFTALPDPADHPVFRVEPQEARDMSDQTIKFVLAGALTLHGLGHGGALAALAWIRLRPGTNTGAWLAARSWLVPSLPGDTATTIASGFWILSMTGFVSAAMSFWGVVIPGGVWRPLAVASAIVSIAGIVLFFGTWPMFNTLAALGVNVAVLVAVLWLHWPPQATLGR